MDPDARPSSQTNRKMRQIANAEDVKHVLEKLWNFDPDETFHKTFSREDGKGAQGVLYFTKEDLEKLTWREDNDDITNNMPNEVVKTRNLKNYKVHLMTGKFPSESIKFRHNAITLDE